MESEPPGSPGPVASRIGPARLGFECSALRSRSTRLWVRPPLFHSGRRGSSPWWSTVTEALQAERRVVAPEAAVRVPPVTPLRWSSGQDAWFSARRSPVRIRHGVRIARVKLMRTSVWLPTRRQPVRGRSPVPRCAVGCGHPALILDQGHAGSSPARTAPQEGQAESWRRQPFRKRSRSDPLSVRPRHLSANRSYLNGTEGRITNPDVGGSSPPERTKLLAGVA